MFSFSFPGATRRKGPGWLITALILSALLLGVSGPRLTNAASNLNYYSETGHYLGGNFKTYWEQNGGLEQFGFPLTEVFDEVSPTDGKTYQTQYFERAIFEYHPEFAGTRYQVLLRLAGNLTTQGRAFAPSTVNSGGPNLYYFPETKHSLDGRFLAYWIKWGGLPVYGYPTSEPFTEQNPADGKTYTVQKDDNLYKITRKLYGNGERQDELYTLNKQTIGPDSTKLKPGMVLKLPASPAAQ